MAQSKILLDSNSYFRLAKSIHPLLDVVFGERDYCLYVLKELDEEYDNNRGLRKKFDWVNSDEYYQNRQKQLSVSKAHRKEIDLTIEYLWQYKIANQLGISSVDIKCLAYGFALQIPVTTDDIDMLDVAGEFEISTMKTLELMALMYKCGHITMKKITEIAAYWEYIGDKPAGFRDDFEKLFGEKL
jgi:hypothetical protein